jgi:hypothetical protein
MSSLRRFNAAIGKLPHPTKLVIAGNHDGIIETLGPVRTQQVNVAVLKSANLGTHELIHNCCASTLLHLLSNAIYLENSALVVKGIKFYGSPHSPLGTSKNRAFQVDYRNISAKAWEKTLRVPLDTDVLLTHSDAGFRTWLESNSIETKGKRAQNSRRAPLVHAYGHFHSGHGQFRELVQRASGSCRRTLCVNVSSCDGSYQPFNDVVVIDVPLKTAA